MASPRTHLLRVLRCALTNAPTWWTSAELELVSRAASLDEVAGDALARLAQRTRIVVRRRDVDLAPEHLNTLEAFGWLETVAPDQQPGLPPGQHPSPHPKQPPKQLAAQILATVTLEELALPGTRHEVEATILADGARIAGLARFGPFYAIPVRARQLLALACLAAFASDEDPTLLVRVALGQVIPPANSPLARTLSGERFHAHAPLPWATRSAAEDYLTARHARATRSTQPATEVFFRALTAVQRFEGQALHLGWHHLTAAHHWTRLLAECLAASPTSAFLRHAARRALRRAPCSPALARAQWEDLHAAWGPRPAADRLAREFSTWRLWGKVERAAWLARAAGERTVTARVWQNKTITAWLAHGGARVIADGELVEDHALRRLAADGWQGVHAEGGFWLAAACVLLDLDPAGPVPWCAPLQCTPLDWGRWGYGARRIAAHRRTASALIRDPEAALAAALLRITEPLPGFMSPPNAAALTAVVRHLPLRVLVPLLLRVLDAPNEASGLPDLVVWQGERVAFWEVKSPADQLSAKQRRWLGWLVSEGVTAGVLRIAARQPVQSTLFPAPRESAAVGVTRQKRTRVSNDLGFQLLMGGAIWQPTPGSPVPESPSLAMLHVASRAWRDVRTELPFVDDVLIPLPIAAVLVEVREGRRTVLRRWFPVPVGLMLVGAVRDEALPHGGVGPCVRILTRNSGWLIPAHLSNLEPIVARLDELANPSRDWIPHPATQPPRAEVTAAAWGCADELADQLLLVGAEPHGVWIEAERLVIATDPTRPVLWTARNPRLALGLLPIS